MRKNVLRSVAFCFLFLTLSFLIAVNAFAELSDENRTVNAVESADETVTDDGENYGDSEFISESEALNKEVIVESSVPDNPETGEFFKFMPAVIALVVLVAMVVIKKLRDKKK